MSDETVKQPDAPSPPMTANENTRPNLTPITTLDDYDMAMAEIEELTDLDPAPGSFFGRELLRLVKLVQDYETEQGLSPMTVSDSRAPETREGKPLSPWEAREILGGGPESGRPGYLQHHPDCSPPKDCLCNLFGIQNRLREIAASPSEPPVGKDSSFEEPMAKLTKLMRCNTIHGDQPPGFTCLDDIEESERWIADYTPTGDAEEDRIGRAALKYRRRVVAGDYACRGCSARRILANLSSLFAKQREEIASLKGFSRTAYLSANRELEAKLAASYLAIERRDAQIASLQSEIAKQRGEIKARGEIYGAMCERLHECCQRHGLGLGGEHVDRLVVEEVDRLRALESELERQRETTLTPEEAELLIMVAELSPSKWALKYQQDSYDQALVKLRLLSSSPLT